MKRLVVNADDFGLTRDVNEGIVEAHRRGILTAASLMANGRAFDHAVALARENPSLDVGAHLTLAGRFDLEAEIDAQIAKILEAGIRPTHLDTHKHTHLFPPVLRLVARASQKHGIPWVRRPFDYPLNPKGIPWSARMASGALGFLRGRFHRVLAEHGCRTTDHFAGFQITGRFGPAALAQLIRRLPDGSTEFMCHPGFCGPELRAARTRLKESRARELEALTSPEVRAALDESGVRLVSFREL